MSALTKHYDPLPVHARTLGMWLFLAALTMLFLAAMLGYVLVRINSPSRPATGSINISWLFALSSVIIIAASFTIERAVRFLQLEKQRLFKRNLNITLVLTLLFIAIQTPSLIALLATHDSAIAQGISLYGLVFVLILLHALHVLGGLIPLLVTIRRAARNEYDHENISPIRSLAMYWHFLDAVWIVMLVVLVALR